MSVLKECSMIASVGIIAYNHERFIAQTIESVLMQRVDFQYEIVIGEDCSFDRTRDIVIDFQKKHPKKIRLLLHEKNIGDVGRRNFTETFMACKGEYVAWLDGDDFWTDPDKLQRQVEFLNDHPECSLCFHPVKRLYEDGRSNVFYPFGRKQRYTLEDVLKNSTFIHASSIVCRSTALKEFPSWFFRSNVKLADWTLYVLGSLHGEIGYIDEVMSVYRRHRNAVWSYIGPFPQILWDIETRDAVNTYLSLRREKKKKRPLFDRYLELAKSFADRGDHKRARKYLMKCILNVPFDHAYSRRYLLTVTLRLYCSWLVPSIVAFRNKFLD